MKHHVNKIQQKQTGPVANSLDEQAVQRKRSMHLADNRTKSALQKKELKLSSNGNTTEVPVQKKENKTGLPDNLKSGIENLSGHTMDDVKVHYNSSKPAEFNAHAYAQGTNIHIAAGQEKHLPHEAWHVVQQKQGRVKPTIQLRKNLSINEDKSLESEADKMGGQSLQQSSTRIGPLKQTNIGERSPIQYNKPGTIAGALGMGAIGAGIGAAIGSVVPVLGTLVGALAGGAIGALTGAIAGRALSPKTSWYDLSAGKWRWFKNHRPDQYRPALLAERPAIIPDYVVHGFASQAAVPVYIKKRTRRSTKPGVAQATVPLLQPANVAVNTSTDSRRTADTRMLDRMGRVMIGSLPPNSTPHLALVKLGQQVHAAGNTGGRRVRAGQDATAEGALRAVATGTAANPTAQPSDDRKLKALLSHDYSEYHPHEQADLEEIGGVIHHGNLTWQNVNVGGQGSIHGEMALLDQVLAYMNANPKPAGAPLQDIPMAGVKKDCLFCQWSHELFNIHEAAPRRYSIKTGGTHGLPFPGWKPAPWMLNNPVALAAMQARVAGLGGGWAMPAPAYRVVNGGAPLAAPPAGHNMNPYDSDSDREDV